MLRHQKHLFLNLIFLLAFMPHNAHTATKVHDEKMEKEEKPTLYLDPLHEIYKNSQSFFIAQTSFGKDLYNFKNLCVNVCKYQTQSITTMINKLNRTQIATLLEMAPLFKLDRLYIQAFIHAWLKSDELTAHPEDIFADPYYLTVLSKAKNLLLPYPVHIENKDKEKIVQKFEKRPVYGATYDRTITYKELEATFGYGKDLTIKDQNEIIKTLPLEKIRTLLCNEPLTAGDFSKYEDNVFILASEGGWIAGWNYKTGDYYSFEVGNGPLPCNPIIDILAVGPKHFYLHARNNTYCDVCALTPAAYLAAKVLEKSKKTKIALSQCKKKDFSKSFFLFDLKEMANKEFALLGLPKIKSKKIETSFELSF